MIAISLWEPWATAIAVGLKRLETRSWNTNYRGRIAIHAAKTREYEDYPWTDRELGLAFMARGINNPACLNFGCVVATAMLVDTMPTESAWRSKGFTEIERKLGDYSPGRWAWLLDDVQRLAKPVPAKGKQGFWEWEQTAMV